MKVLRAGLIGEHISRTRLPAALDIMCEVHEMDLHFSLIDTAHLSGFDFIATVDGLRDEGWAGVTVTHPYKTHAAEYANDGMQAGVAHLGAANTLVFRRPLEAFNTDYTGFLSAWRAHMGEAKPGRVAMAGAGGVACALGPALAALGAEDIVIWDKDPARAQALAKSIGTVARSVSLREAAAAIQSASGVVNATPMGMAEYPGSAFQEALLGPQDWAFDAVYTPSDTEFLIAAGKARLEVLSGFDLFQHMAIRSFEAYTGLAVDPALILPKLDPLRP